MNHLIQVLCALTQLLNTLLGGYADETTSSRAYRCWPLAAKGIDLLARLFFQPPGHCERAYYAELLRAQQAPELR